MTVAAFVLGVVATVFAVASLAWQVVAFLGRRARPKLTPVVGVRTPDGLVIGDARSDIRESLRRAAEQRPAGPFLIGVKVANTGRAPFHVAEWAIRADPGGTSLAPAKPTTGGTEVPHDIPAGASALFITEMQQASRLAESAESAEVTESPEGTESTEAEPPRIVLTVSSGARTYATKPVASGLFSLSSSSAARSEGAEH